MSNIYVHEPPTDGKVLLKTTVGDIEVELWSKEAPKACRNFVQLCMEGYYDGTIFHRVIKEFIVQGGDPDGDGNSVGESIYGKPFNDEFHSRLRFVRRGLVAMANSGKNDNTSHFFFTLGACTELNNKNTIFGRIGGDTIYNMLKLGESETDSDDRPLYPQKINRVKIISNPFEDIVPREKKGKVKEDKDESSKVKAKAVKNFSLLSFGDEAREDEEEVIKATEKLQNKSKSSHDLLDDKHLSSVPAVGTEENEDGEEEEVAMKKKATMDSIREKLKRKTEVDDNKKNKKSKTSKGEGRADDDDVAEEFPEFKLSNTSEERIKKYKKEAKQLLRDLRNGPRESNSREDEGKPSKPHKLERNLDMFKGRKASDGQKGKDKDSDTMDILTRFKKKIQGASRLTEYGSGEEDEKEDSDEKEEDDEATNKDISWMTHKLICPVDGGKVLDANIADLERYEIYDPRNPITQRRKKESASKMKNVKLPE